ncbi:hypothetical protein FQN50_007475 [Emmonsiellopsis sp. PD_5]|nr:hypothetical protein FQN50_007475 [Emmonsiellopsis sp. PD_5]
MAARATQIVKVALRNGELPPDPFPIDELSGEINRPDRHELRDVYGFHHFARCLEKLCRSRRAIRQMGRDEAPGFWKHWQERLHSSIYRFYLAGAVLYRAYQEPLLQGTMNGPPDFLSDFAIEEHMHLSPERVTNDDAEFLLKYPAYNLNAYEEHGSIFKPLADLFANEAKKRALREDSAKPIWTDSGSESTWAKFSTNPGRPNPVDLILFHETVQFLLIHETIRDCKFTYELLEDGVYMRVTGFTSYPSMDEDPPKEIHEEDEGIRRIQAIRFGDYVLDQVSMPAKLKKGQDLELVAETFYDPDRAPYGQTELPFQRRGITYVIDEFFKTSAEPNHYDDLCPCAPPELRFIEYLLRNYLGMQFTDRAFQLDRESHQGDYCEFVDNPFFFGETDWHPLCLFECASDRRPQIFKWMR